MKNWYGNVSNRLNENHYFNNTKNNIEIGTLATIYSYSDRHAYEVVKVINQKHIFIRRLKAIRTDKNGMSDSQSYRFEQNLKQPIIELKFTYNHWRIILTNKLTNKKYTKKTNISFGVADEYYDYSF